MTEASGVAQEIEYKFLLTGLPQRAKNEAQPFCVEHGWITGDKGVIKLRITRNTRGEGEHWWCVKFGKGLERTEAQETISKDLFEKLFALTEGKRVHKVRFPIEDGGFIWEFDNFIDRYLTLMEVEVPSVDTKVVIPEWIKPFIVRDVTNEPEFLNVNLAK